MVVFLGSRTSVADLRHGGMKDWESDTLKMLVRTPASWSAHSLRTLWSSCLPGVHRPQCALHLMFLHPEAGAATFRWSGYSCLRSFNLEACEEVVQLLCKLSISLSRCGVVRLIVGELLDSLPHLPRVVVVVYSFCSA